MSVSPSLKEWQRLWAAALLTVAARVATSGSPPLDVLRSEAPLIALVVLGLGGGAAAQRMRRGNLALTTFVLTCPLTWCWAFTKPTLLLGPLTLLAGMLALLLVTGSSALIVALNASIYLAMCALVATDPTSGGLASTLAELTPVLILPTLARRVSPAFWDRWERRLASFSLGF